ncbi:MAG: hypothetical protein ACK4WH_08655, partial [Phycisphaerales bacterium]
RSIIISGQLTKLASTNCEAEAIVKVMAPNGQIIASISPFGTCTGGTRTVTNFVHRLSVPYANAAGTWYITFREDFDDPGIDARWDTITITLDDGPPSWLLVADAGAVRTPGFSLENQSAAPNSVRWYRFSLPLPAGNLGIFGGNTYLDIDTEGSPSTDMELALYDADGRLIATDDDSGSGNQARLSFGAGPSRPAIGNGLSFNNSNGTLDAGMYYLAVGPFNSIFGPVGWKVSTDLAYPADFRLNIRTNIDYSPFCRGDHNKAGTVTLQDLFDFLADWFNGCP